MDAKFSGDIAGIIINAAVVGVHEVAQSGVGSALFKRKSCHFH
jgi:hypothetical protein